MVSCWPSPKRLSVRNTCPAAESNTTPQPCWTRCSTPADARSPTPVRRSRRCPSPIRVRPFLSGIPVPVDHYARRRVARPTRRSVVPQARRRQGHGGSAQRPGSRPVLLGAQDGLAARQRHHRRSRYDHRHLAGSPPDRTVRHRHLHRQSLPHHRSRHHRLGHPASGSVRAYRRTLPAIVANDALVGQTDAFGPSASVGGLIVDQQAALLAQRS